MQTEAEANVLDQVTSRLRDKLPGVPVEKIHDEVRVVFAQYADSKVRDFLPILVERDVVARLRARAAACQQTPRTA